MAGIFSALGAFFQSYRAGVVGNTLTHNGRPPISISSGTLRLQAQGMIRAGMATDSLTRRVPLSFAYAVFAGAGSSPIALAALIRLENDEWIFGPPGHRSKGSFSLSEFETGGISWDEQLIRRADSPDSPDSKDWLGNFRRANGFSLPAERLILRRSAFLSGKLRALLDYCAAWPDQLEMPAPGNALLADPEGQLRIFRQNARDAFRVENKNTALEPEAQRPVWNYALPPNPPEPEDMLGPPRRGIHTDL